MMRIVEAKAVGYFADVSRALTCAEPHRLNMRRNCNLSSLKQVMCHKVGQDETSAFQRNYTASTTLLNNLNKAHYD